MYWMHFTGSLYNKLIEFVVDWNCLACVDLAAFVTSVKNTLPENVINASTLQSFQHHLKTFLFWRSFLDIVL